MGTVFPRQSDNMKLIAVLALAAVAFAEPEADPKADPWLTYGYAGYGLPYAGVYGGYRTYGATPIPMDTTARGPLRPSLRLRLTPLFCMAPMAMDTPMPVSMEDTEPMVLTPTPMPTTARGPLRLSPRLRLTPLFCMAPMAMDSPIPVSMEDTGPMELTHTPMDTTARGLLRPSPRLRLTLLSSTPPPALLLP